MKFIALSLALSLAVVSPQRLGVRLNPPASGPSDQLTSADFTLLGMFRLNPSVCFAGAPNSSATIPMTGRRVAGATHLFSTTTYSAYGYNALCEWIDPGSYSSTYGSAPQAALYRNWGWSSDASYDMWHGLDRSSYNSSGVLSVDPAQFTSGIGYHEVGGRFYAYMNYSPSYGSPPDPQPWTTVVCELVNPGTNDSHQTGLSTDCTGPYRFQAGVYGYGGGPSVGPRRVGYTVDLPDGTMGIANGKYGIQQFLWNKGPSLFGGLPWLTTSTTQGFGSTRSGNPNLRTTDLIMPDDYLAYYSVNLYIGADGKICCGGDFNWTMRRPPHVGGTYTQYISPSGTAYSYDGTLVSASAEQPDPDQYSGLGTVTAGDSMGGAVYIGGSKTGFITASSNVISYQWYKTRAGWKFIPQGTGTPVLLMRNVEEAHDATYPVASNMSVSFAVTPANYSSTVANVVTVTYVKDGAGSSRSCTVSGKAITVHLDTNGSNVITSTANNVVSIVNSTGVCSALVTASLNTEGDSGNNGTGVVSLVTTDVSGSNPPVAGVLYLVGGAEWSPVGNVDCGITVTGPTNCGAEPALQIWNMTSLSQTPDYTPDPTEWMWLHDISANIPCNRISSITTVLACTIGGMYFDPVDRKLFVMMVDADVTTAPGLPLPVILAFQVAGSPMPAPAPSFAEWLWSMAPKWLTKSTKAPPSLLARPR